MINFEEDLRNFIKEKKEYEKMRSEFILNKDVFAELNSRCINLLCQKDPLISADMNRLLNRINENLVSIKNEGLKRNMSFEVNDFTVSKEFVSKYVEDMKNTDEKRIEFVVSGNRNLIRSLERAIEKDLQLDITKVFETDKPIREMSQFKNEVVRGYLLDLKSAELLYTYLQNKKELLYPIAENNEEQLNIQSRMYWHIDSVAGFDIRSNFKTDLEEGCLGMDKLKFSLNILKKPTLEETFHNAFIFQITTAIQSIGMDKETVFDYMLKENSENLLRMVDMIETKKLDQDVEVSSKLSPRTKGVLKQ